jgi:type VI secretion system protein ImpH
LVGLGTDGLRNRLEIADATWIHFGGHFAHYPRNAIALARMIASYFCVPAAVEQFQGQWLRLERHDQSRMGGGRRGATAWHQKLGQDVVVGERVWSVENRFRLRLGPVGYGVFRRFMPDGDRLTGLRQFIRFYAGPEFDFDVQVVLEKHEVPAASLASALTPATCRLGWNSWITSQPRTRDADEAVFAGGAHE